MGDLKKSKHLLAEMGIDVEELKEMSQSIMNASSSPMSQKNSPQKGARSTRGGAGRTAQHGAARHVHETRDKSRTCDMLHPKLECSHNPNPTPDHRRLGPAGHGTWAAAKDASHVAWGGLARSAAAEDVRERTLTHTSYARRTRRTEH